MSIRFSCSSCKSELTALDAQAGTTINCNLCGQRVDVPESQWRDVTAEVIRENNEPLLLTSADSNTIHVRCPTCGYEADEPGQYSGNRATCPRCETEFGTSSTQRQSFEPRKPASAVVVYEPPPRRRRSRDDEYEDDEEDYRPRRRRRRRRYVEDDFAYRCPYCGTKAPPMMGTRISTGGWITFAILLAFCWPLFWIGLLITEPYSRCSRCGGSYG